MNYPSYNDNHWLLVEDDLDDQNLFLWAFEEAGIKNKLVVLSNGIEAVEFILKTKESPFVIISDINMPKMNGLELLKEIKEIKMSQFKSIPFLIISSSTSEEEIALTYQCGAQGYFTKTIRVEEQIDLILSIQHYWSKCRHPAYNLDNKQGAGGAPV